MSTAFNFKNRMGRRLLKGGVSGCLIAISLVWGCSAEEESRKSDLGDDANDKVGAAEEPTVAPQSTEEGPDTCDTARDCTYALVDWVESVEDCECPRCPDEADSISRGELERRKQQFRRVCSRWARANGCEPELCSKPAALTCTEEGRCALASK